MLVAAEDTTIKRAAGFTGSMFTVNGGNLQMAGGSVTDSDGTAAANAAVGAIPTDNALAINKAKSCFFLILCPPVNEFIIKSVTACYPSFLPGSRW